MKLHFLLFCWILAVTVTCEESPSTAEIPHHRPRPRIHAEKPRHDDLIEGTFLPHRVVPKKSRAKSTKDQGDLYRNLRNVCLREYYCLWRCLPKDICLCLCGTGEDFQQLNRNSQTSAGVKGKHDRQP